MPLSEKALRAWWDEGERMRREPSRQTFDEWRDELMRHNNGRCFSAFQAALLEELREKVERNTCDRAGYLRRDYVLALLSPPPPEPKWTVGDWVVPNGEKTAKLIVFIQGSDITLYHGGGHASGWHRVAAATDLRPATDEEVRRARGEEQP